MNKKTITFLLFLVFFILYYAGSFSKISFGDCIGFVADAEKRQFLPDLMPLTHFLYLNTAIAFTKYLGMDSIFVMRMMSVIPGALTVSFVYVLIREFVQENWIAITSTAVFGLSFTFWRSASTIEVYTFNALWIILFLICAVKSLRNKKSFYLPVAGILLALSFWVHIQNILLIPAYLALLFFSRKEKTHALSSAILFVTVFGSMFLVNALQGIEWKYVFISREGGWIQDTFRQSAVALAKDVLKALAFLIYNFNIFVIAGAVGIAGIADFCKSSRQEVIFLSLSGISTLGFATFYAVTDNYVFFIPFYLIFTILIAHGIEKIRDKFPVKNLIFLPILIPLFYILCLQIALRVPQMHSFHQQKLYKGGLTYYTLPWLHNNVGCIEFTLSGNVAGEDVTHLKKSSSYFIKLRSRYQSMAEIRKL